MTELLAVHSPPGLLGADEAAARRGRARIWWPSAPPAVRRPPALPSTDNGPAAAPAPTAPVAGAARAAAITCRRMLRKARSSDTGPEAGRPCMPRIGAPAAADRGEVQHQRAVTLAAEGHRLQQFDGLGPALAAVVDAVVDGVRTVRRPDRPAVRAPGTPAQPPDRRGRSSSAAKRGSVVRRMVRMVRRQVAAAAPAPAPNPPPSARRHSCGRRRSRSAADRTWRRRRRRWRSW